MVDFNRLAPSGVTELSDGPHSSSLAGIDDEATRKLWAEKYRSELTITPSKVMETFSKYEDILDANHDGFVQRSEVKNIEVRGASLPEELMLEALVLYQGDLQEMSNDEFGDENSGITKADIKQFTDNWDNNDNLDLIRRIDFLSSQSLHGRELMDAALRGHLKDIEDAGTRIGYTVGGAAGMALGVSATMYTGALLAPLIPVGLVAGASGGAYLGRQLGRVSSSLISTDGFYQDYVDKQLDLQ